MNWGKVLRELQGRAKAETGSAEGGTCTCTRQPRLDHAHSPPLPLINIHMY